MSRGTTARIDTGALRRNLRRVRELAPGSRVVCVVKADAYGHGMRHVCRALDGADLFAVATVGEARMLRAEGWSGRLLLLEGFSNLEELDRARRLRAELVLHEPTQLEMLAQRRGKVDGPFWIKLNTGMNRLGFPAQAARAVRDRLAELGSGEDPVWMSHFACADEPENPMTGQQIERFDQAVRQMPGAQSLANSAGVLNFPESHRDYVRPGIMLYGISPCAGVPAPEIGLEPAMSLECELIAINACRRGDAVGYGARWRCPEDLRIGVAAIGYGDGYPRHLRSGAPVVLNGRRASLAGRVSMDMITLDLRGHDDARVGDTVRLWGPGLPVEELAPWADAVPYEFVCGVTRRVRRREA